MAHRKCPFGIEPSIANSKTKATEKIPEQVYQNCISEKLQMEVLKHIFDPSDFHQYWQKYKKLNKPAYSRAMRVMVQIGTVEACLKGRYQLPDGRTVILDKKALEKCAINTTLYPSEFQFEKAKSFKLKNKFQTEIKVIQGDCLEAALWLKSTKKVNPIVLNMASSSKPNGGYLSGAGAQEENITRRTNYFQCLDDPYGITEKTRNWSYPLPEFGGVYSKDVLVFRKSEFNSYAFMENPERISIVGVSAYKSPPLEEVNGVTVISKKIAQLTKRKISAILNIALENGHDSIVLSAFGCGAYGNPSHFMAELFKEVIQNEFSENFRNIIFAIINDHNAVSDTNPEGNVTPFAEVFGCEVVMLDELIGNSKIKIDEENKEEEEEEDKKDDEKNETLDFENLNINK